MLITLIVLVAIFFISRTLLQRYGSSAALSNGVAAAIVVAFVAGFAARSALFQSGPAAAVAVAPAPIAPAAAAMPPGVAVSPLKRSLPSGQLAQLARDGKPVSYSVIEDLGGSGSAGNEFPAGTALAPRGWAGDPTTKAAAAGLLAIVDDKPRLDLTTRYGTDRLDVARAFQTMAMLHTGFAASIPTTGLSKGLHHLELAAIHRTGRKYQIISMPAKPFIIQ